MDRIIYVVRYFVGCSLEICTTWWIMPRMVLACQWAGYDLARIARGHTPSPDDVLNAASVQWKLLQRRYDLLERKGIEGLVDRRASLVRDTFEWLSVIAAMHLVCLITRLKGRGSR